MNEEKITDELYSCFNLIRSTVEGIIPYNNGETIWNIPGSLKRAKKASFVILTNGLRKVEATETQEETLQVMFFHPSFMMVIIFFNRPPSPELGSNVQ